MKKTPEEQEKPVEKRKKSSPDYSLLARHMLEVTREDVPSKLPPGLYIVATPIGNLGDISLRALKTLADADIVACEDTRVTGALLHHYGIKKHLISYHDHNADERQPEILSRIAAGESVALASDAGTPLISDPGYKLVQNCRANGYVVTAIPGASALLTALVSTGLPTDKFLFAGFLPPKKTARKKAIAELATIQATLIFYETPNRLQDVLDDMENVLGTDRPAAVARELTKLFEEINFSTLGELAAHYRDIPTPKGEIVILVGASSENETSEKDITEMLKTALKKQSLRDAVASVTETTGAKKSEVYKQALKLTGDFVKIGNK